MEDFEIAVYDSGLYYSGQLKEWLEFRTKKFKHNPKDYGARYRYVEALVENKKFKEALRNLEVFHKDDPDSYDFNQEILDCLRKLNLEKSEFNWTVKPKTLCLTQELQLLIVEEMKKKRKRNKKLYDIYSELSRGDLLEFDEDGLMKYLKNSQYFKVKGSNYYEAIVERL